MQKPFVALPLACLITCNADGQAAPESLARVEVTGSHIKGVAAHDAAPVQVLDRADIRSFGASTLLGDIERQLEHYLTGRYSADYRHPMA